MKKRVGHQIIISFFAATMLGGFSAGCAPSDESGADRAAPGISGSFLDLTYAFDDDSIFWPTAPEFELTTEFEGMTPGGFYYSAYSFSLAEHGGTHLDAPVHFAAGKMTNDELPLEQLIGPAILIDVSEKAMADADYLISVADFEAWEKDHGQIPDGSIVLIRTGFGSFWPDKARYLGTAERGVDAVPDLHFPGLDPVASKWLVDNRNIHAFGLDTASIDRGQSTLFESHQILYGADIPGFENVANLDQLPATGFSVIALPMKIRGGSGGPLRIIAVLP
jgi:kynurenine formamidase